MNILPRCPGDARHLCDDEDDDDDEDNLLSEQRRGATVFNHRKLATVFFESADRESAFVFPGPRTDRLFSTTS